MVSVELSELFELAAHAFYEGRLGMGDDNALTACPSVAIAALHGESGNAGIVRSKGAGVINRGDHGALLAFQLLEDFR